MTNGRTSPNRAAGLGFAAQITNAKRPLYLRLCRFQIRRANEITDGRGYRELSAHRHEKLRACRLSDWRDDPADDHFLVAVDPFDPNGDASTPDMSRELALT
ncbi:hypothetical protein BN961_03880 [Afipia felis]|uniref:Uncharacterized protein n=1 Tax=Afipia felis TaxID=1035 RepID=A0A090MSX4_AFIFE|nr:hypothetical protein BN961_03880 [Afipia felis]